MRIFKKAISVHTVSSVLISCNIRINDFKKAISVTHIQKGVESIQNALNKQSKKEKKIE